MKTLNLALALLLSLNAAWASDLTSKVGFVKDLAPAQNSFFMRETGSVHGQPASHLMLGSEEQVLVTLSPAADWDTAKSMCQSFSPSANWDLPTQAQIHLVRQTQGKPGFSLASGAPDQNLFVDWAIEDGASLAHTDQVFVLSENTEDSGSFVKWSDLKSKIVGLTSAPPQNGLDVVCAVSQSTD